MVKSGIHIDWDLDKEIEELNRYIEINLGRVDSYVYRCIEKLPAYTDRLILNQSRYING